MAGLFAPGVSAVFLLSYGTLGPAHEIFYAQLGLSPEEVGLNEVSIVARSITYGVLLIIMVGFLALGFIGGYRAGYRVSRFRQARVGRWIENYIGKSKARRIASLVIVLTVLVASFTLGVSQLARPGGAIALFFESPLDDWSDLANFTFGLVAYCFVLGLSFGVTRAADPIKRFANRINPRTIAGALLLIVISASMVGVLRFWDSAARAGEDIMAGRSLSKDAAYATEWLRLRFVPIRVTSSTDPLKLCESGMNPVLLAASGDDPLVLLYRDGKPSYLVRLTRTDYTVARGTSQASLACGEDVQALP